jgi:flagellar biosynthesis/type III secretory pathway chaperone
MTTEPLQRLAMALEGERQALVHNDVPALVQATAEKLAALRELESAPDMAYAERLRELAERNLANGRLLARRRREVNLALRQLGRSDATPGYNANGQTGHTLRQRSLAVA